MRRISALLVGMVWLGTLGLLAGQGTTPSDNSQAQPQTQSPSGQDQTQTNQQQPKKKGGLFGGLKAVTGTSSDQTEDTAAAGSKGVGEGARIADATPTAADRSKVAAMENYSIPKTDLEKFEKDGKLVSK